MALGVEDGDVEFVTVGGVVERVPADMVGVCEEAGDVGVAVPEAEWGKQVSDECSAYLTRSITLKMGMYRAMIMEPTTPPRKAIISGSIRLVSASAVASTSWS